VGRRLIDERIDEADRFYAAIPMPGTAQLDSTVRRNSGHVDATVVALDASARDLNRTITRAMFDLMDTDGDNQIGLAEYAEYLAAHRFDEAWAANAFKQLDTDGDGIITRDQYNQISADFFFGDDEHAPGNWLWGSY